MKTYICQICGKAYIGTEKPSDCPFCGATANFLKLGNEAAPIINQKEEIGELSQKNLLETLALERAATAIYECIAEKAEKFEIKAMYERLAQVENEHAIIVTKFLAMAEPEIASEKCSQDLKENLERTIDLEDNATKLYARFAREAAERNVKIFFTALAKIEAGHIELIKGYLQNEKGYNL
jgi:rubrerythrin